MSTYSRRYFLKSSALLAAGAGLFAAGCQAVPEGATSGAAAGESGPLFRISLAQWSLHRALFRKELDNLDFARVAKQEYGVEGLEYVNQFFKDKGKDRAYLQEMKTRAEGEGLRNVLIMVDGEGYLGDPDEAKRVQAVENHHQWVEAAQFLGCHAIRVNAYSEGSYDEQVELAADGLRRLCEFADPYGISVIVENHGGLSSNGSWLATVMETVDHPRVGTLPDFGNFRLNGWDEEPAEWYDRYQGVDEMMPYAKGVSAKSNVFDAAGNESNTDYRRMLEIVLVEHGYRGFIGIEYEGEELSEPEGIRATKALLERIRAEMSATAS